MRARSPIRHAKRREVTSSRERIYALVRRVPRGKVATYGQIAALAGSRDRRVRWASDGRCRRATRALAPRDQRAGAREHARRRARGTIIQQQLLEREGVAFDNGGRVALARFGWKPRR